MIEIVYSGPAGSYRAFEGGVAYKLPQGVPTEVPGDLAERLCEGEEFNFAQDAAVSAPEIEADDEEAGEPVEEDDPAGVNADDPYGEE